MSILCGEYEKCKLSKENCKECDKYVEVFTDKDFDMQLLKEIASIYSTQSIFDIKRSSRNRKSLSYFMGIFGHCTQYINDSDSIFYLAGTIVLVQQHNFKECTKG